MRTSYKVVLGAVVGGVLIWGGVAFNQKLVCDGLEEDYLNAYGSMSRALIIQGGAQTDRRLEGAAKVLRRSSDDRMQSATEAIFNQCGERAAETALRKASESSLRN